MNTNFHHKRPPLHEVLAYKNDAIVASFSKTFGIPPDESQDIFEQVKRMMWLTNEMEFDGVREQGQRFFIDHSLLVLDEMWHTFILFTKPYADFCMSLFGHFIHHFPTVTSPEDLAARQAEFAGLDRAEAISRAMDEKRWQYTYVYKKLGEQCFLKWYHEFHKKYTLEHLAELRYRAIPLHGRAPASSHPTPQ